MSNFLFVHRKGDYKKGEREREREREREYENKWGACFKYKKKLHNINYSI